MRVLSSLVFVSVVGVVAFAWAKNDDVPAPHKAGLWEISVNTGTAVQDMKVCFDTATEGVIQEQVGTTLPTCSSKTIHRDGNVITSDSICTKYDTKTVSHEIYTLSGDMANRIETTATFDPAINGSSKMLKVQTWLGSCPAGTDPGDIEMNGMMINAITGKIKKFDGKSVER